jgi:prolipoprotein diacylglyceryltransferase
MFHLAMAGILLMLMRLDLMRQQRLKFYLIAYGIFRFLTEFIRPEKPELGGLTFYQWVAAAMIAGLSVQWWWDARTARQLPALETGC